MATFNIDEPREIGKKRKKLRRSDFMNIKHQVEVKEDIKQDVIKSFAIRNSLNSNIWEDGKIKPEIRLKLLTIGKNFL